MIFEMLIERMKLRRFLDLIRAERLTRLSGESLSIVIGQAMAVIGALVGVRLVTELLDPAQYGELTLALTAATLLSQVVLGPLSNGVTRFYAPALEQGDLGGYLNAVRQLVLLATGAIFVVILLTVGYLLISERAKWVAIAVAALAFAIFSGYNSILNGLQNAARHRTIVALHQGMDSWVRWLAAVSFMLVLGANSAAAMAGYVVAALSVFGSQYGFFRKNFGGCSWRGSDDYNWREKISRYSLPFATWGIFTWLQLASDRWALEMYDTTHGVGLYAVLYQLGYYPVAMVTGLAIQFVSPILFHRAGDATDLQRVAGVDRLTWQLTWVVLGLTFFVVVVGFMLHRQIFHLVVAKQYWSMSYLLPWVLLASGVFAAAQPLGLSIQSKMRPNVMAVAIIVSSLVGVVCNVVGAYMYGVAGVVFAGLAFSVLYSIWMATLSRRALEPI